MTDATEVWTTVPFCYEATLTNVRKIPAPDVGPQLVAHRKGTLSTQTIVIKGYVHPEPYGHPEAVHVVQAQLAFLTDHGWKIEAMHVRAAD